VDKNTAIREAELRRIEASLAAMHQAEQALAKEKRSERCQPTHWKSWIELNIGDCSKAKRTASDGWGTDKLNWHSDSSDR